MGREEILRPTVTDDDLDDEAGIDVDLAELEGGGHADVAALRPRTLAEFVGQAELKDRLRIILEAARRRGQAADHLLFAGPPGLGKTTLAGIVATEMDVHMHVTSGPTLERAGDLAAILTKLGDGDVLFIDEIHRLSRAVEEVLYPAVEDFQLDIVLGKGPAARSIRLDLPRFTLVGATTRTGLITGPFRDRFGLVARLDYYDVADLEAIVGRAAGIVAADIDIGGAHEIARRSRGTPRIANRLLRRVRDFAEVDGNGVIDARVASQGLAVFGVDELGLDKVDRAILSAICDRFGGGPVGLSTLAISVSEPTETVEDVYEPFLIQQGLMMRTPRGRVAMPAAWHHLGLIPPPAAQARQDPNLFDLLTRPILGAEPDGDSDDRASERCQVGSPAMLTAEFDYELPADRIAAQGIEPRDAARLLVATGTEVEHRHVRDLPSYLRAGDVVVVNDTRVLPARVRVQRSSGGAGEVLLLEDLGDGWWEALVRPSAKLRVGAVVAALATSEAGRPPAEAGADADDAPGFEIEIGDDLGDGRRRVRPLVESDGLLAALDRYAEMPLPPYLGGVVLGDPDRYQTVYSRRPASAAAPTAGLHLTEAVMAGIAAAGARLVRVELVVGLGTFRPITAEQVENHHMHAERYRIAPDAWATIERAGRVVAIGTTSVRALESAAAFGALEGSTELFIRRPFDWQVVDVLMTNFHLPKSSLLVMIDAFVGPRWRALYHEALAEGYRFLSFGDAMLLARTPGDPQ